MSIIIRLQNLPWAADSGDIRRYFSGLSIPEGGVHIVGGEMGDAFIAFSTDEDARLAMAKDGGKIHEMQIKLLLSSRQEMARVIERARQQNVSLQSAQIVPPLQPPQFSAIQQLQQPLRTSTPVENERRSRRSPTPPRRHSRDRDSRDRRRSPDSRRSFSSSKRDRSRSPSRSSRSSNRDMDSRDRRSDRFKRDDRRYSNEDSSKYNQDRHTERHRYSDADNGNNRSQLFQQPYQDNSNQSYYPDSRVASNYQEPNLVPSNNNYSFNSTSTSEIPKDYPSATSASSNNFPYSNISNPTNSKEYSMPFYNSSTNEKNPIPSMDGFNLDKINIAMMLNQVTAASNSYVQKPSSYDNMQFEKSTNMDKAQVPSASANPQERKRKSRFEPEPETPLIPPFFTVPDVLQKLGVNLNNQNIVAAPSSEEKKVPFQNYQPANIEGWPQQSNHQYDENWNNKSNSVQRFQNLLNSQNNTSNKGTPIDNIQRNIPDKGNEDRNLWHGPSTTTIEIRRLPFDARVDDFLHIFRNIPLSPVNICLQLNNQRAEKAFLRFSSIREFNEAMNLQPILIRNCKLELIPCPASVFEAAVAAQLAIKTRLKMKPREEDLILQLKGLPFQCTEHDVVRFFDGLRILDIFVEMQSDGRCSGLGFVEFATIKDFKDALTLNGKTIGHRYITISVGSKEILEFYKKESFSQTVSSRGPPQLRSAPTHSTDKFGGPRQSNNSSSDSVNNQDLTHHAPLRSHSSPRADHAPLRAVHPPSRSTHSPPKSAHLPSRDMHPLSRGMQSPQRDMHPPSRGMHSPQRDMHPPSREMHPPPRDMQPPPRDMQPPPRDMQPPSRDMQPPPRDMQPPPRDMQPPPRDMQPPSRDMQPPSRDMQPPSRNIQPPPRNTQPPPRNTQPPPRNTQPPPRNTQPPPRNTQPPPRDTQPPSRDTQPPSRATQPPPRDTQLPLRDTQPPPRDTQPPPRDIKPPSRDIKPPPRDMQPPPRDMQPPPRDMQPPPRDMQPPPRDMQPPPRDMHPPPAISAHSPPRSATHPQSKSAHPPVQPVRGNFCIAIRGLPKSVTNVNLGNFFKEIDVCALGVHVIVDTEGPTGEAYVEVPSEREVDIAVNSSGILFHNCHVNMTSFPMEELDNIIGRPPPSQALTPGPLLRTPLDAERPPRRPLIPRGPLGEKFRERPPLDFPPNDLMRGPGPMRGGRPRMNRAMRPPFERPMRPPFGRMRGPRPDGPREHDNHSMQSFGAPGCVVSIHNLHFSAGLEELLEFFSDFRLTKDNIKRRYENQHPTGEARVTFENPREALRAVRELDLKSIMGRTLHLSIL